MYSYDNITITDDYFDRSGISILNSRSKKYTADSNGFLSENSSKCNFPNTLVCFHGSPGTSNDFKCLEELLPNSTIKSIERDAIDCTITHKDAVLEQSSIITGTSWGCRAALEYFSKNPDVFKKIILISPHIINTSKSAIVTKFRPCIRLLLKVLLRLEKSFTYKSKKNGKNYKTNKHTLLKRAVLFFSSINEKTEHQVLSYASILRLVTEVNTPLHVITGTKDHNTHVHQTLELIRTINSNAVVHFVNGGSHNILETHSSEIASIIKLITSDSYHYNQYCCREVQYPAVH